MCYSHQLCLHTQHLWLIYSLLCSNQLQNLWPPYLFHNQPWHSINFKFLANFKKAINIFFRDINFTLMNKNKQITKFFKCESHKIYEWIWTWIQFLDISDNRDMEDIIILWVWISLSSRARVISYKSPSLWTVRHMVLILLSNSFQAI